MTYTPPYRIENGSVYEYNEEHNAYVHMGKRVSMSRAAYASVLKANEDYEKQYDARL